MPGISLTFYYIDDVSPLLPLSNLSSIKLLRTQPTSYHLSNKHRAPPDFDQIKRINLINNRWCQLRETCFNPWNGFPQLADHTILALCYKNLWLFHIDVLVKIF